MTSVEKQMYWILPDYGEKLWRKVSKDYPEVTLEHMLVDNCAMQLVNDRDNLM